MENNLRYMKPHEISILKEKIWLENNKCCPVLGKEIPLDKMVLDHKHKNKNIEPNIINGAIRTALEFRTNALFGKIENAFKRLGLDKDHDLVTILRNGAEYLEAGSYFDGEYYIHPNEVPKRQKVKISDYNKIKKYYLEMFPKKRTIIKKPTYITEEFEQLLKQTEEYIINLNNIKAQKKLDKLNKKNVNKSLINNKDII